MTKNSNLPDNAKIAVLIPCYNEAQTIADVVRDFKEELPEAEIYVYDNNSADNTDEIARNAGAIVRYEKKQGKGNVVKTMFAEIDADCYVMVDGDNTYPPDRVREMCRAVLCDGADMVIGDRLSSSYFTENKKVFNSFGNVLVRFLVNTLFRAKVNDIMTGLRVMSKRFVKTMPRLSGGFEIETEMTIYAVDSKMKIVEIPVNYRDRPMGSVSKLNTFKDGFKVLKTVGKLWCKYRSATLFTILALISFIVRLCLKAAVEFGNNTFASAISVFGILTLVFALIAVVLGFIQNILRQSRINHINEEFKR